MRYTFLPNVDASGGPDTPPAEPEWATAIEQRLLGRVEEWLTDGFDDRVIRIVEDRLRDETERRAWRGGAGVF